MGCAICLRFLNLVLSSSGFVLISEWALLNGMSFIHYPPPVSPAFKYDSRGPKSRAKISLSSFPPPTNSPRNRQHLRGQCESWDFRNCFWGPNTHIQSPLSEAQRHGLVGGRLGSQQGWGSRAWSSNCMNGGYLLVDCAVSKSWGLDTDQLWPKAVVPICFFTDLMS